VEWVKHNLSIYTAPASAFAFERISNLEKFSFPLDRKGAREIFEKMKENFSGV